MSARLAVAVAAGLITLGMSPSMAAGPTINVRLFQFRPAQVQVAANSEVMWANDDDIKHTVTSGSPERPDGRFDLELGEKGATGRFRFAQPGVYPYFCNRHQHMRGEVRVN